MATYEEIYGKRVKEFDSDPTLDSSYEGQVWYDKSSGVLKSVTASIAAWASQGPLLEARSSGAGFGVSTAAVYAGGQQPPGPGAANTFEYNGNGWSTGGDLNTARMELGGTTAGIETAGLCFGGNTAPGWNGTGATEEYNGTAWTSVNNMATTVSSMGGSGIQTAAFSAGGRTPSNTNNSQEYDGTNWTNGNNINTTRQFLAGMGTQTAGIIAGGESPSGGTNSAETYDGTNFTAAPNMGTARYRLSGSGSDSTACLVFGGRFNPPAADKAQTESFDGTSWTETADLATARQQLSGNRGTSSSAIAAGGLPPPASQTTDTEEFTQSINTITAAAWASGTALPSARFNGASAGTATAGIIAGGELAPGTRTGETVYFDGSSWTAQPATLSPAPNADGVKMAGTQTASILNSFRGGGSPGPAYTDARSWNGSTWTSIPSTSSNHSFSNLFRNGTPSAATTIGGDNETTGIQTAVEEYNGSSWGSETALPAGRGNMAAFGTPTAGVIAGGNLGPGTPNRTATALEYNGSSWTTTGNITEAATVVAGGGTQTTGIIFGGYNPSPAATGRTNTYNGTVFSSAPTMATARGGTYSIGDSSGAYAAGGNPPVSTTVEEFTAETTAVTASTLTTS